MFTQLEIAGMIALVAIVFGVGFLIQRLDSVIAGGDESPVPDGSASESAEERADEPAPSPGIPAGQIRGTRRSRRRKR